MLGPYFSTVFWLSLILHLHGTDCTDCYSCTDVDYVERCQTVIKCSPGQICYKDVHASKYTLGCRESTQCSISNSTLGGSGSIVGRSVSSPECSQCCETSMCNRQLCQSNECHDSGHIDCATTGQFVNMCGDKDRAKQECRQFCGLCSMVDGDWSAWSTWSTCSASCGNGTATRTRSCSSPAPADGGTNCTGNSQETTTCINFKCPGWSSWSDWDACSQTCGVCIQTRFRSCTNPPPPKLGVYCTGTSIGVRTNLLKACVDGGWAVWGSWGSCSQTCGVCTQKRSRSCTNPAPSALGKYCLGNNIDVKTHLLKSCVDGGWTAWGSWGSCSQTCDVCTQKRSRSCTNPAPSTLGKFCLGHNMDVKTHLLKSCVDQDIGFTVHTPTDNGTSGHITFTKVVTNSGGGYNTATGEFTCKVAGAYAFSLTLLMNDGTNYVGCVIYKGTYALGQAHANPGSNVAGYFPASVTVYVHLLPGDNVFLGGCSPISYIHQSSLSSFSGYLIHMD